MDRLPARRECDLVVALQVAAKNDPRGGGDAAPDAVTPASKRRRSTFRLVVILGVVLAVFAYSRAGDLRKALVSRKSIEQLSAAASVPGAPPSSRLEYGKRLIALDRLDDAMITLKSAQNLLPESAIDKTAQQVFSHLGYVYAKLGRGDDAVPLLLAARDLDGDDPVAYLGLGYVFSSRQMFDAAETQFRLAAELEPNNSEAWFRLGKAANEAMRPAQAIEFLTKAIKLKPASAEYYVERGHSYAYQARFAEAVPEFLKATELKPAELNYKVALGSAYAMRARTVEDYKRAVPILAAASAERPKDSGIVFNLGTLHLRFNEIEEAHKALTTTVKLNPSAVQGWYNLARVEQRLGNNAGYEKAQKEFTRLTEMHDGTKAYEKKVAATLGDPKLRVELAKRYLAQGNLIGAYWQYWTALKLKPGDAVLTKEIATVSRKMAAAAPDKLSVGYFPDSPNTAGPPPPSEIGLPGASNSVPTRSLQPKLP